MVQITAKELQFINDVLTYEGLLCKKARMYSRTLTDTELSACMGKIADAHEQRYQTILSMIGGGKE